MIFLIGLCLYARAQDCKGPQDCGLYCRVTYNGKKSFYNSTDGNCYAIIKCLDGQLYEYSSNSCISQGDIPEGDSSAGFNSSGEYVKDKKIICVNGKWEGNICVCFKGYYTSVFQDPGLDSVNMCDTKDKQKSFYSEGENGEVYLNNGGDSETEQVGLAPVYKIIILLVSLVVCCCFNCCLVRKMKKRL